MKRVCDVGHCVPPVSILKAFIRASALVICLFGIGLHAQEASSKDNVRFLAVDIYVDSKGKPLAAYQLEFSSTNGAVKIVGIEGGEHPAFREPPHYDPKAMQHERVIIAAFSTSPVNQLPSGRARVATIHLQFNEEGNPRFKCEVQVIANARGNLISAEADFQFRKTK